MRLSKVAILALRGSGGDVKKKLAEAAGVSEPTLYRYIADNDDNLTKAAVLQVIREVTGLGDGQILVEPDEEVAK